MKIKKKKTLKTKEIKKKAIAIIRAIEGRKKRSKMSSCLVTLVCMNVEKKS